MAGHPSAVPTIEDRDNAQVHHTELRLAKLPDGWRSPHAVDSASGEDGTADGGTGAKGASVTETNVARQHRFRVIVYRFFRRSLSEKNEIVGALRLVDEDDSRLVDVERFKLQLVRARERGQLDALEAMITKLEGRA